MKNARVKKLAVIAMLAALSVVLVWAVRIPLIPMVSFLEYDPADIPILIGALAYGPVAGVVLTVVVSLIQGLTVSASSGVYGILMHIVGTGSMVLAASLVYKFVHTKRGGVLGLILGVLVRPAVMLPANHFITPAFTGWPVEQVDALLLPGILPFNLITAGINCAVTFLVYKTVSRYLIHGDPFAVGKGRKARTAH
ncbi:MAG TPA: ECF transporter S component [Candidatus Enterenecus merdae]|nr:ECF transporter S component [Candidatus Enterenecus merdae]